MFWFEGALPLTEKLRYQRCGAQQRTVEPACSEWGAKREFS